eukprot:m.15576 g.15576  ORF g.15576 m.15576 type:complete len:339 (-) comp10643_c0_seq1:110-1126(-)
MALIRFEFGLLAFFIVVIENVVSNDFPFLFDVGMNAGTKIPPTGRVVFDAIFECPHPCGLIPSLGSTGPINGGVPQSSDFNLTLHLSTLETTFTKYVALNDTRWIDLDYESWDPVWSRNTPAIRNYSIELAKGQYPGLNSSALEAIAQAQFESASLNLLTTTVKYVKSIRPGLKIGLYSFPTRFYYNGYDSANAPVLRAQNDKLFDLWCLVDGLFPSVYQFYNSTNNTAIEKANQNYVSSNVAEAVRIAKEVPTKCTQVGETPKPQPPVFVYTWHRYHSTTMGFVSDQDESMYWIQSYAAGATGIVLWGSEPTPEAAEAFGAWWTNDFSPLASKWSPI